MENCYIIDYFEKHFDWKKIDPIISKWDYSNKQMLKMGNITENIFGIKENQFDPLEIWENFDNEKGQQIDRFYNVLQEGMIYKNKRPIPSDYISSSHIKMGITIDRFVSKHFPSHIDDYFFTKKELFYYYMETSIENGNVVYRDEDIEKMSSYFSLMMILGLFDQGVKTKLVPFTSLLKELQKN
jgi:hypothetical protein